MPEFSEAVLVRGVVNTDGTATLNLTHPLQRRHPFIAQDGDFSPYYFALPKLLSAAVKLWLAHGPADEDLFLILKVPDEPWPGPGARAPGIGLDGIPGGTNDVPIYGRSFVSTDGGATFTPETRFNFMFSLLLSEAP